MTDIDDDELDAFIKEDFSRPEKEEGLTAAEERIIAGFEDIQRFHAEHGRLPQAGTNRDIFERIYAVRLNALRQSAQCRAVLAEYDTQHWLTNVAPAAEDPATMSDDELLAQLQDIIADDDLTTLKHVRSPEERQAAEYIANREPCANFAEYAPRFASVRQELQAGIRQARPFKKESGIRLQIEAGDYFILGGQIAYIAEAGEPFKDSNGAPNARLRVIFDNATESPMLSRSLQRALYKDETGRRITARKDGAQLFGDRLATDDIESGTIYVLRSLSPEPQIRALQRTLHKIGVTGGKVETRIANAENDATFLLAAVEIVAEYQLANINRTKLEKLLHQFFASAQIDITINDRFGRPVQPKEWFAVPLAVIDEAVRRIQDGSITDYRYNPKTARLELVLPG